MTTYKMILMGLLILNAVSGIWSAKILYHNDDKLKSLFSFSYALACAVLVVFLIISKNYHQWPMVFIFTSSLLLFTIDRIRGKEELMLRKMKK